jgi:hypothetical protein
MRGGGKIQTHKGKEKNTYPTDLKVAAQSCQELGVSLRRSGGGIYDRME